MLKIPPEFNTFILTGLVILTGAFVHSTNKMRIARENNEEFTWVDFFVLMPTSAFSGLVFGLFVMLFTSNIILLLLSAAIGSWLGVVGLNSIAKGFLATILKKLEE